MHDISSLHEKLQSLGDQPVLPTCKAGDLALARLVFALISNVVIRIRIFHWPDPHGWRGGGVVIRIQLP